LRKVLTVVGARPQVIKAAPVGHALAKSGIHEVLVHTGQHFDPAMSDIFFEELDVAPPAYNLDINNLSHGAMTGRMLEKIEKVLLSERPDCVLVYGDTNSTLAGALAAAKLDMPIAHVEAGLRSFNRKMPEEINRVMADHLSSHLYCPTATAVRNLAAEGITRGVHAVGDVMYDTALYMRERASARSDVLERLGLSEGGYAVATVHRAENTDDPARLAEVIDYLGEIARQLPIVMPLHPRTAKMLGDGAARPGIRTVPPLGYLDMTLLVSRSAAVYTDSGGLQKEAYFHRVPCVTLRDETEWVETIDAGWNRLWTEPAYAPRRDIPDYGEGKAAVLIATLLSGAPFGKSDVNPAEVSRQGLPTTRS
jgi:UDP-GlcNAc3NAcA epimerase